MERVKFCLDTEPETRPPRLMVCGTKEQWKVSGGDGGKINSVANANSLDNTCSPAHRHKHRHRHRRLHVLKKETCPLPRPPPPPRLLRNRRYVCKTFGATSYHPQKLYRGTPTPELHSPPLQPPQPTSSGSQSNKRETGPSQQGPAEACTRATLLTILYCKL